MSDLFRVVFDGIYQIITEKKISEGKISEKELKQLVLKEVYAVPTYFNLKSGIILPPANKKNVHISLQQVFNTLKENDDCFCRIASFISMKIIQSFGNEIDFAYFGLLDKDIQMDLMFLNMHYHKIYTEILKYSAEFLYKKLAEEKFYGNYVREFFTNVSKMLVFDFIQLLPHTLNVKYSAMIKNNINVLMNLKKPTYQQLVSLKLKELIEPLTRDCDLSFLRDIKQQNAEPPKETDLCAIEVYANDLASEYFEDYIDNLQNRIKEISPLLNQFTIYINTYDECVKMKENKILSSFFEVRSIWEIQKIDIIHELIFGFKLNNVEKTREKFLQLENTLILLTQRILQN